MESPVRRYRPSIATASSTRSLAKLDDIALRIETIAGTESTRLPFRVGWTQLPAQGRCCLPGLGKARYREQQFDVRILANANRVVRDGFSVQSMQHQFEHFGRQQCMRLIRMTYFHAGQCRIEPRQALVIRAKNHGPRFDPRFHETPLQFAAVTAGIMTD